MSRHRHAAEPGTAGFAEFDFGLRAEHSRHEVEYTPDLFDAFEVVDYGVAKDVEEWDDVEVKVMEMCYHIPFPLLNRVFALVVVTALVRCTFGSVWAPQPCPDGTRWRSC